jgi:assimilatory nitrate reductase catalytic subunit
MVAVTPAPPQPVSANYPFRLNTGRVRDHWHTMTRTGLSPRLSQHMGEPFLEIHPEDARALGLQPATLARVTSPSGAAVLRVLITDRVARGHPFAPIHWMDVNAPSGRVGGLVPSVTDPVSGQPALKSAPVAIIAFDAAWYGFAVTTAGNLRPDCDYWARAVTQGGDRFELAGRTVPADWQQAARHLLGVPEDAATAAYDDRARGQYRCVFSRAGVVCAALYVAREPVAVARGHVADQLGQPVTADLLAGRPGADRPDPGATICACFGVGRNTIKAAAEGGLATVDAIGHALRAGTNCGSCRPEIAALLAACRPPLAVAAE